VTLLSAAVPAARPGYLALPAPARLVWPAARRPTQAAPVSTHPARATTSLPA